MQAGHYSFGGNLARGLANIDIDRGELIGMGTLIGWGTRGGVTYRDLCQMDVGEYMMAIDAHEALRKATKEGDDAS